MASRPHVHRPYKVLRIRLQYWPSSISTCPCLQAVRAMRFDPAANKPKDKLPTERTMTDAEVAKAIEEAESEEP